MYRANRVHYGRSSGFPFRIVFCIAFHVVSSSGLSIKSFGATGLSNSSYTCSGRSACSRLVEAKSAGAPASGRPADFDVKSISEFFRSRIERGAVPPSGSRDGAPVGFVP